MRTSIKVLVLVERHGAGVVRPQQSIETTGELVEARPIRKIHPTNVTTAPLSRALLSLNRWLARAS